MAAFWQQCEGQVVGGAYPLRRLLGSTQRSAVYLSARDGGEVAVKLLLAGG